MAAVVEDFFTLALVVGAAVVWLASIADEVVAEDDGRVHVPPVFTPPTGGSDTPVLGPWLDANVGGVVDALGTIAQTTSPQTMTATAPTAAASSRRCVVLRTGV